MVRFDCIWLMNGAITRWWPSKSRNWPAKGHNMGMAIKQRHAKNFNIQPEVDTVPIAPTFRLAPHLRIFFLPYSPLDGYKWIYKRPDLQRCPKNMVAVSHINIPGSVVSQDGSPHLGKSKSSYDALVESQGFESTGGVELKNPSGSVWYFIIYYNHHHHHHHNVYGYIYICIIYVTCSLYRQ